MGQVLLMKEEDIEQVLAQMANRIVQKIGTSHPHPLTDWISEEKASDILGYSNLQHLRLVVRENDIVSSKKGKKFYYSLKSINQYLESGKLNPH